MVWRSRSSNRRNKLKFPKSIVPGNARLKTFDYIVIGGGSAGCVMASRLAEQHEVLLLEAGPKHHAWDFRVHMPAALS